MTLLATLRVACDGAGPDARISGPDLDLSYLEFRARVDATAASLVLDHGLSSGDRVAYLGQNSVALLILMFAAARAGLMLCPMNWRLAKAELAWILSDADPSMIFAEAAHAATAQAISGAREVLAIDPLPEKGGSELPDPDGTEPLLLVYTSGTTGRPKGAVLTQGAVLANARLSWDMHDMSPADHVLNVLPMFHVGGLNIQTVPGLLCGARVTLHERFAPDACLTAIREAMPTLMVQVPATLQALMAHRDWGGTDLSCLRAITTGSTDVPVPLIEAVQARDVPVIQIYGATETGPLAIYQRIPDADRIGTIGRAGPGVEVRIVGPEGEDLPDERPGEIWLRSPTLASGYWRGRDPETFAGGWFRTGDVAWRDAGGLFWFADRIKNVIISGGENIYPAELERILATLPEIAEASVVAREDTRWGAVPVVVAARCGEISAEGVLGAFDGQLARYKHPKDVIFVDALPRNAMGKVVVEAVRALAGPA